jgi:hypothetical protein
MHDFPIGAIMRNFGNTGKVIGYRHDCLILRGYGLRDAGIGDWLANPALCERLDAPTETLRHKDGLVAID